MTAAGLSQRTIAFRIETLGLFARRAGCDPATSTWQHCSGFLADDNLSRATKVNYYSTLNAWFTYLQRTDQRADNPMLKLGKPKQPKHAPRPVTTEQLRQVLASGMYRKTRMMIMLAAFQGLRVSEIARMRGQNISGDTLRVIGKSGTDLVMPLHEAVAAYASAFPRIGLWFPSKADPARPVNGRSIGTTIALAMRRAGVNATAHQLRHWFGTNTLETAGGNIRVVQELMRHASITSTMIYTLVGDEAQRTALDGLAVPLHAVRSRSAT